MDIAEVLDLLILDEMPSRHVLFECRKCAALTP